MKMIAWALAGLGASVALGGDIQTNAITSTGAPAWVDGARIDKITDKIQTAMEWDIRKVTLIWYTDPVVFEKAHGNGPGVVAFTRPTDNTVHIGPRVTTKDFDGVFAHELVHVTVYQKYKDAIPKWIEEGLANYVAGRDSIDYSWLNPRVAAQGDVRLLVHPFKGFATDPDRARYQYMASKALVEMVVAHCSLTDLLQLSVGKKFETYLDTFCSIPDVNSSFKTWVGAHSRH